MKHMYDLSENVCIVCSHLGALCLPIMYYYVPNPLHYVQEMNIIRIYTPVPGEIKEATIASGGREWDDFNISTFIK